MIANKYEMGEEIKRGKFGCIYKGLYKREPVAIKMDIGVNTLKHEVRIINYLTNLKIKQIPSIYWYGLYNNSPCLVITLYECSLYDYMQQKDITIPLMNVMMINLITILDNIHTHFVLHRDIKPQNFMIKNGTIYIIDFGLATFYVDENGEHYPDKPSDLLGSPKFMSIHIHDGHRPSRRDDMISLGYMYIYMIIKHAPWFSESMDETKTNKQTIIKYIDGEQIAKYMQYIYTLEYTDVPKYTILKLLLDPC